MMWRNRYKRRVLSPVAGILLALFWLELTHVFITPDLIPSLFQRVQAAVDIIDPNGNGAAAGTVTVVSCGTANRFDCLDDGVRNPTSPGTADDYIDYDSNGAQSSFDMETIAGVDTATQVAVQVYHVGNPNSTRTNMRLTVSLWNTTETVQYGASVQFLHRATPVWDTATIGGLNLTQADLDGLRIRLQCDRVGGGPVEECRTYAMYADVTYDPQINVTVAGVGTQQNIEAPATNAYIGGAFSIAGTNGTRDVTSITINESGTVDAQNNLKNIRLFYDLDTGALDCSAQTYDGTEPQFGSTVTGGFSGANGSATFSSGGVSISPTQTMCVYVVADVENGAAPGETIEIQITNPTTDVVATGSPVIDPATPVLLPGTTNIQKVLLTQTGYHWRNDDGSESGATSATGGTEDTSYDAFPKNVTKRLRFEVANEGNITSPATQYRLEYATKVTDCSAATGWTDVGAGGGDFDMSPTGNLTDGGDTTNVAPGDGGITDPGGKTFLSPNGGVRDTTSQTGNITLTSTQFVDLEYAIIADVAIVDGTTFCFRVTNAGTPLPAYTTYAEATIAADLLVASIGSVNTPVTIPTTDQYAGGAFVVTDSTAGTDTITSITITASGTVDVTTDIQDIRLRYDLSVTAPYDCSEHTYNAGDTPFGTTAASFTGGGEATFTGSVAVSPTQSLCLYVEYTASSSIENGQTLTLEIANPSAQVLAGSATVAPASPVALSGTIEFASPFLVQTGYHWRQNNGSETTAESATGGSENTLYTEFPKDSIQRLRFRVANTGLAASPSVQYRLEWVQRVSSCEVAVGWERMDTVLDEWEMAVTANLTDGANTTNIATSTGGVTDGAETFLDANGGVKDTTDTTAGVSLPANNFLELEYAVRATDSALQGATYCFRITDASTPLDSYTEYAEATIKLDTDFKIQRREFTMLGTTQTLTAGVDYDVPSAASAAFIRITNTQHTGAGPDTGNSNNNANAVTVYISNPANIMTSITFVRGSAVGNTRVSWEIIEYQGAPGGENEFIVRSQAPLTYVTANLTVNSGAIAGVVDDADVAVFITSQYNPDGGRNNYHLSLSTAEWDALNSRVTLTRGATGNASIVSYAAVEFTGSNWRIQRVSNTYTNVSPTTETQPVTLLGSLTRAFVHAQKRTSQNNHADYGHEVWLSSVTAVSFRLNADASTAANHTSVAWVIENTQTTGARMVVTPQVGTYTAGGTGPQTNLESIGKTLSDLSIASLFVNNSSNEAQRSWPEPILSARLISTTQFELWRSDTTADVNFRSEVVEWPTAARKIEQNYYRFYQNTNSITPVDPWPSGASPSGLGENEEMTAEDSPLAAGDVVRVRMTLTITSATLPPALDAFTLQYAERVNTCSGISSWSNLGDIGSSTAIWRGFDNSPADGTPVTDLLISVATVPGTYEEQNNSALNPELALPGDEIEYDWVVQHNGAKDKTSYCFRMVEADGTGFTAYNFYPVVRTVGYEPILLDWRWYDDAGNITPTVPLAAENSAPIDILNQDTVKLRLVLRESSGATGVATKFAVQFSEESNFSEFTTLSATSTCEANSLWCYADGGGVDNDLIPNAVISSADPCVASVGDGCGTHNEGTATTTATFDHTALTSAEFEFTLRHAGARTNAVYYFRLYDVVNDELVSLGATSTYPSLVTEGAQLVLNVDGLPVGTTTAGITTDVATTPAGIEFGIVPVNTDYFAAHRLRVDTNATEGYQIVKYARQQLLNSYGTEISPIPAPNSAPVGWALGCDTGSVSSCVGYHTTDAVLRGGSGRFSPLDSYAGLHTTPEEVMFSAVPVNDVHDIVYRVWVNEAHPPGDYESEIVYIAIPAF